MERRRFSLTFTRNHLRIQTEVVICILVTYTFAVYSCYNDNSISICTDDRRQGGSVYVDFSSAPLFEINASCSCFIFAQSDTEIFTTYQTYSHSDIILVNTSIRLGDQTFQEASNGFIQLSANSFKKLQFNGDIGTTSPGVCLRLNSSLGSIDIEVACLRPSDETVPTSGFTTSTKMTSIYSNDMAEESTTTLKTTTEDKAEKTMTFITTESGKQNQTKFDYQPDNNNCAIIGGTVGGGIGILAVVIIVVLVVKFRSGTRKKTTPQVNTNQRKNDVTHNYVNTIQLSSGGDIEPSENLNYELLSSMRCDAIYDQPKSDVK